MTRLSGKNIVQGARPASTPLPADFQLSDMDGAVLTKGITVIHEKAYLCACKSKESDHLNTCKNCGGVGWIFANPTKTKMIITSIQADAKLKEAALRDWGFVDLGTVKVTALNQDKLSFMDRITILDASAEHNQLLYPVITDGSELSDSDSGNDGQTFAYTKYDIVSIDYLALFESETQKLKKLEEFTDYTFRDNVLLLSPQYNELVKPCVTIRYVHRPVFHVFDILRESMVSQVYPYNGQKITLPNHALAKRAHLIKDVENFDGNRLFDNSWKPETCQQETVSKFERQLKNTPVTTIYENLTQAQRIELAMLIDDDSDVLGIDNGVLLQVSP